MNWPALVRGEHNGLRWKAVVIQHLVLQAFEGRFERRVARITQRLGSGTAFEARGRS